MPNHKNNQLSFLPKAGYLTTLPAAMIDRAYLTQPNTGIGRVWSEAKIRLMYTLLFPPLECIDMVTAASIGTYYSIRSFYASDALQKSYLKKQATYSNIFSKNLYSLAAFPFGIINPKLISFYFTPDIPHEGILAGGHYHHSKTAIIKHPKNVKSLQEIIKDAAATGKKVMVVGAGKSQGKQFIPKNGTEKIVVDLDQLNTIEINKKEKIATVGAGVRWYELQKAANKNKLAIKVMQASNIFAIGGAIGTNIHGWDHLTGMLSNTILELEIIDAQGERQTLTPKDRLFHLVLGGLGLFGIVTQVKMKLADNELLKEIGTEVPLANYVSHFHNQVESNPNIRMHLFRLSLDPKNLLKSGVAVDYVKDENTKREITPNLSFEKTNGTRMDRIMINLARRLKFIRKLYWEKEHSRLLTNNSNLLSRNQIMQPPINAMFNPSVSEAEWLQEYFLPEDQLADFLNNLSEILTKNNVILLNASVRFVKQNKEGMLSYAKDGDRFAVVLCFNQSLHPSQIIIARKWLREAQALTIKHGGSYYLPYQHVSSPEAFHQSYPNYEEVRKLKKAYDPDEVFSSGFYHKYIADTNARPNYFKTIMATPESQKQFSGFLENVLQRVDTKKFYALLNDIMSYKDSHAEIYKELTKRLAEIMPSKFGTVKRILSSLSEIKHDLLDQAKIFMNDTKQINGLVEIGYPGRFVNGFKSTYQVTGKIVAVNDAESITDYIQTGFPRPYDQFAKLDYNKPNLASLADNSAEVITCYIGLHHFPDDEVEVFLQDVRRVLKPGGKFLLVDHDVVDEESMAMAHMAHTIYNAVYGVSLENELSEIRHFHPMTYWQALLANHDLGYNSNGPDVPMIRHDDPSRNRMACFVNNKPLQLQQDNVITPIDQNLSHDAIPQIKWKKPITTPKVSAMPIALHRQFVKSDDIEVQQKPTQKVTMS